MLFDTRLCGAGQKVGSNRKRGESKIPVIPGNQDGMEGNMKARIEYGKASPEARKAMFGLAQYLDQSGWEHSLLNLIDLRASQINGCAYCLDMHWKDLKAARPGPKRSRGSMTATFQMKSTRKRGGIFPRRNWWISRWRWSPSMAGIA